MGRLLHKLAAPHGQAAAVAEGEVAVLRVLFVLGSQSQLRLVVIPIALESVVALRYSDVITELRSTTVTLPLFLELVVRRWGSLNLYLSR